MPTYYTHYNGDHPFQVNQNPQSKFAIISVRTDKNLDNENMTFQEKISYKNVHKIWIGRDRLHQSGNPTFSGNTILIQPTQQNFFIALYSNKIFTFHLDDTPIQFFSDMGNSDVPQPILVSKKNVYLFATSTKENLVKVPRQFFRGLNIQKDAYDEYYTERFQKKQSHFYQKVPTKVVYKTH